MIIAAHLAGDILLQNRWLAKVKRESMWGLLLHCFITTVPLVLLCGWWDYRAGFAFCSHLAIDGTGLGKDLWPRLIDQGNPDDNEPVPMWLSLLDDQAIHILVLSLIGGL